MTEVFSPLKHLRHIFVVCFNGDSPQNIYSCEDEK